MWPTTSAIVTSASAAHCIMNTNKDLPITSDKIVSSASKRKVSDYNGEPYVDAYLEQFDLVATHNCWSESEKNYIRL